MINKPGVRVLLVEDNPGNARLVREMLEESEMTQFELVHVNRLEEGLEYLAEEKVDVVLLAQTPEFQIQIAETGQKFLELLRNNNYHVLLVDCLLPDLNAVELLKRIAHEGFLLPVVIVTGAGHEDLVVQAEMAIDRRHLEQKSKDLESERAKLDCLLTETPAVVYRAKAYGDYGTTFISANITAQLGYAPEEFTQDPDFWANHIHPKDATEVMRGVERLLQTGKEVLEYRFVHKNGEYRWMRDELKVIKDTGGNPVEIAGYWIDITDRKQAEDAVREKTKELDRYFDSSLDLLCIADTDGYFRRLNPEWEKTLGYPLAELEGKRFLDFVHPDDLEATLAAISQLDRQVEVLNFENRYRCKDGSYRWIEWRSLPQGKAIYAVARDITERKRAEEVLRASLRRFELLTGVAGDLLLTPDPQELVETLCTRVMDHLDCHVFLNFLADEKAGRLHLNACAGIPDEEARRIEWLDCGVIACECAARDGCRIVAENIGTTPDPRTEIVKSYGIRAYACHPLLGTDAKAIGTLSFGTRTRDNFSDDDLSLMKAVADQVAVAMIRVKDHEALRESEERHRTILRTAMDGFCRVDLQGRLLEVNETYCRMSGYSEQELLAMSISDLEAAETPAEAAAHVQRIQTQGEDRFESRHRRKDGSSFAVEISAQYKPEEGHLFAFLRDVTERKNMEAQLLQAQKMELIGQLATGIAHQLNTPLAVITMRLQMLQEDLASMAQQQFLGQISTVMENTKRMSRIIQGLLNFSRVSRLEIETVRINDILERLVGFIDVHIRHQGVLLSCDFDAEGPTLCGDKNKLEQGFLNILMNALDAMPQGGRLSISSAKIEISGKSFIQVEISDTGCGMSSEVMAKLSTPFFTTKPAGQGTGLGLSISYEIIRNHGGEIRVESREGRGSTFRVLLPAEGQRTLAPSFLE